MDQLNLVNINKSQKDYLAMILQFKKDVDEDNLSVNKLASFMDDIKCFWLGRLKIIECELNELTEDNIGFLLSGAIYLNISKYDHYYFKSFGDFHLLNDPLLKMEPFIRVPNEKHNIEEVVAYFKRVYFDVVNILTKYESHFYILPISEIAIENQKMHQEMLDKFALKFLSSAFNTDFKSKKVI
jgi:hypothetical protein